MACVCVCVSMYIYIYIYIYNVEVGLVYHLRTHRSCQDFNDYNVFWVTVDINDDYMCNYHE